MAWNIATLEILKIIKDYLKLGKIHENNSKGMHF